MTKGAGEKYKEYYRVQDPTATDQIPERIWLPFLAFRPSLEFLKPSTFIFILLGPDPPDN